MNEALHFHSRVGADGVLKVQLQLGPSEAEKEVEVTVKSLELAPNFPRSELSWLDFIEQTYGSCAGLGLERQPQGEFEQREQIQ